MPHVLNRKIVKSQQFSKTAYPGGFQVPLQFMEPAISGMDNPMIRRLRARIGLNVDTGSSGGPARQFAQSLARVLIQDGAGDRVNVKASSLRILNYAERTGTYRDGLNIAASQTAALQNYWLDLLPVQVINEQEDDDHGILVSDLLNGGQIYLTWGIDTPFANYLTFNGGCFVELYADIWDATDTNGKVLLPPRNVWTEEVVSLVDYRYKVGGINRWSIYYAGDRGEDTKQGLSAQNLFSEDFKYQGYPLDYFQNTYIDRAGQLARSGDCANTVPPEDPFCQVAPQAVMFFGPESGQQISDLPVTETFQMRTDGSIGSLSPVMIKGYYTKRSPVLEQAALKAANVPAARQSITATGNVGSTSKRVSAVQAGLGPFLPIWV